MKMLDEGKKLKDIRAFIDKKYTEVSYEKNRSFGTARDDLSYSGCSGSIGAKAWWLAYAGYDARYGRP
jgi:hypothetical protein